MAVLRREYYLAGVAIVAVPNGYHSHSYMLD
jgi:hypothetical protein